MSGFKRAQVIDILGISVEMFLYWRRKLDPQPTRREFSVHVLLAYHILNVLIKKRGMRVAHIVHFDREVLFERCQFKIDFDNEDGILVIDNRTSTFKFEIASYRAPINDYEIDVLSLYQVVAEFRKKIFSFGLT
jgi:hypothetical protein